MNGGKAGPVPVIFDAPLSASAVLLNGRLVSAARARISVFDRGLLYGDGLFETLRAYRGHVFALDAHLARLHHSAAFLRITVPAFDWQRHVTRLLRRNRLLTRDASVRITLTRGPGRPGVLPPARCAPTVLMTAAPIDARIPSAQRRGVRVVLLPFAREDFLAAHKLLHYVPAILGRVAARSQRAFEGLYVGGAKQLSEGTTSNLFLCRQGRLMTPPLRRGVLPGVTRRWVIELARSAHLPVQERPLRVSDLLAADEAFCTSSLIEILPIVRVADRAIGDGKPGPITRQLQHLYREAVAQHSASPFPL